MPLFSKKYVPKLLLHDLQQLHGANLGTNATGNALGSGLFRLLHHNLHGAGLNALSAANAELFVDHIHAGLGILGDSAMLAGSHTLTALDAGHGLCTGTLGYDLDTGQILMELLIEGCGTSTNTLQASHTFYILLNSKFLHDKGFPSSIVLLYHYTRQVAK